MLGHKVDVPCGTESGTDTKAVLEEDTHPKTLQHARACSVASVGED